MSIFEERYKNLNKEQKEAVDNIEGPMLVVAGPGSGKTELLSIRVANILNKTDVYPSNILCLTFTESAAINMRNRLAQLIGQDAYRVSIHTFHNFGVETINNHPEYFYNGAIFSPADELVQIEIMEGIFDDLPYDSPVKKEHPEQGYTYLKDAKKAIASLKKAGLTPDEFKKVLDANTKYFEYVKDDIHNIFDARLSKKIFPAIEKFIEKTRSYEGADKTIIANVRPVQAVLSDSLEKALSESVESGKTAPLTAWKSLWIKKDENGRRVLKDAVYAEKMNALCDLYRKYQDELFKRGYFDFDDMLLNTIHEIERNNALRFELQERYQYILVDEFQDTNDAQMRMLYLLCESDANEGRPNIMAVGDDDQAIFKFQGAEISNILGFRKKFKEPKFITLKSNYRSTQDILDIARHVIKKGEERLENIIPEIEKELVAENRSLGTGNVVSMSFPTRAHEYNWISKEIGRLLKGGAACGDIAIITRNHKELEAVVPYLHKRSVPIRYERQQDVLKQIHIRQLILMSRFIVAMTKRGAESADSFLPTIMSYPFWNISRKSIWEISVKAYDDRKYWINCMLESPDEKLRSIAEFFLDVSAKSEYEPLEYIINELVGAYVSLAPDNEDDDITEGGKSERSKFASPFKEYYFSRKKFEENCDEYLRFLSSLRVFIQALREYKSGKMTMLSDLVEFADMHEKNNVKLTDTSPFVNSSDAVQLLTVHKAKGLEFDTVFVLSCQNEIWTGKGHASNLPFPKNLPILPAGDNLDDQLRLFYVALTRSRYNLYLTSYEMDDLGKESSRLQFLDVSDVQDSGTGQKTGKVMALMKERKNASEKEDEKAETGDVLSTMLESYHYPPFIEDEKNLLLPLIEDYRMSVTHLNNFLDVIYGGPQKFLEHNLLRFPGPKMASASYGTAMHSTLQVVYLELKKSMGLPNIEKVYSWFEEGLLKQRLSKNDFQNYFERGKDALGTFFKAKKDAFDPAHEIEVDFRNKGVVIGKAHIIGKIDKMVKTDKGEIVVCDYKTGSPIGSWETGAMNEKRNLYKYKRQIMFYKLLVENSRDYKGKFHVRRGVLEFLEPKNGKVIDLALDINDEEVERLKKLIEAVYKKIVDLDFPDIEKYSKDMKGMEEFEEDLIEGRA